MPEGPEVEVVKRQLEAIVLNRKIIDFSCFHEKILVGKFQDFFNILVNNHFTQIKRYGKFLVFYLNSNHVLISHLRMEGKYHLKNSLDEKNKHEHVIFTFDNLETLRYHDTRKFGRMILQKKDEYFNLPPISNLAKEPEKILLDDFYNKIKNRKRPIKASLLDQSVIAGLGNIYVDETLFLSKIHPLEESSLISRKQAADIIKNADYILKKSIGLGGTTIKSFSATNIHGKFQNELLVHTKKGMKCPVCSNKIVKIVVAGRGTYICENCQEKT